MSCNWNQETIMIKNGSMNLILLEKRGRYSLLKRLNDSSYIIARDITIKGNECYWQAGTYDLSLKDGTKAINEID
jgi:hypothetical protein